MPKPDGRPEPSAVHAVVVLAWINVLLHVTGLALAVLAIRPGSPLAPLPDRMAFLASPSLAWTLAWGTWALCALALVGLLVALSHVTPGAWLAQFTVTLATAGVAVDLACDALLVTVLPTVAAEGPVSLFLLAERALGVLGTVVANGLYSLAVLLMTVSLRPLISTTASGLGYGTFMAGMLMAGAGFIGSARYLALATGLTILLFVAWCLLVAQSLKASPVR